MQTPKKFAAAYMVLRDEGYSTPGAIDALTNACDLSRDTVRNLIRAGLRSTSHAA